MKQRMSVGLPNGLVCYLTSASMLTTAKGLRWEVFKRRTYLRPGFELRPDDTVIDIGGNIGIFLLWAAPQVPKGRLISVEPNPAALECLMLNISRNGLRNISVVPAAVAGEQGLMQLVYHPGWEIMAHSAAVNAPWFCTGSAVARLSRWLLQRSFHHTPASAPAQTIEVEQTTLSRIMDAHGSGLVNYLKIDCEGSEYEIVRSMDAAHWSRIERVVIEYHDYGRGRKHGELVEVLRQNGFDVEVMRPWPTYIVACLGARIGMIWARRHLQ